MILMKLAEIHEFWSFYEVCKISGFLAIFIWPAKIFDYWLFSWIWQNFMNFGYFMKLAYFHDWQNWSNFEYFMMRKTIDFFIYGKTLDSFEYSHTQNSTFTWSLSGFEREMDKIWRKRYDFCSRKSLRLICIFP